MYKVLLGIANYHAFIRIAECVGIIMTYNNIVIHYNIYRINLETLK